jgi:O-antigen/teichoic acid export membrane protein
MINNILFFLCFFFFTSSAYAYLDPGTGSIILQAIVGAFAAFFSTIYIFWEKVKFFFRKVFKKDNKK